MVPLSQLVPPARTDRASAQPVPSPLQGAAVGAPIARLHPHHPPQAMDLLDVGEGLRRAILNPDRKLSVELVVRARAGQDGFAGKNFYRLAGDPRNFPIESH
jgi:hypothetical protein